MPQDLSQDIRDRTFKFACAVASLVAALDAEYKFRSIIDQLLRSATSVGANLEEAKAASSTREFLRDVQTSLRDHGKRFIGFAYAVSSSSVQKLAFASCEEKASKSCGSSERLSSARSDECS